MKDNLLHVGQMVHKFGSHWRGGIRDILPVAQRNTKTRRKEKTSQNNETNR